MFDGNLLYLGGDPFPMDKINAETYKVTPHQRQDLNSTRNAIGKLRRYVVANKPSKISFTIGPFTADEWETVRAFIASHLIVEDERMVLARFFCPDTNDYSEEEMYMPDPEFTIERVEGTTIRYRETTLKFIGY